jgi:hypothetical protein
MLHEKACNETDSTSSSWGLNWPSLTREEDRYKCWGECEIKKKEELTVNLQKWPTTTLYVLFSCYSQDDSFKKYWLVEENNTRGLINYYLLFSLALQPSAGYGFLVSRCFLITHNDAPQSVGLLWTSDQLVAENSTWQHTTHTRNIHVPGGIRTDDRGRRAAVDLRLRSCGHWDRRISCFRLNPV